MLFRFHNSGARFRLFPVRFPVFASERGCFVSCSFPRSFLPTLFVSCFLPISAKRETRLVKDRQNDRTNLRSFQLAFRDRMRFVMKPDVL